MSLTAEEIKHSSLIFEHKIDNGAAVRLFITAIGPDRAPAPFHGFKTVKKRGSIFFFFDEAKFPEGREDPTISAAIEQLKAEIQQNPSKFLPQPEEEKPAAQPQLPQQKATAASSATQVAAQHGTPPPGAALFSGMKKLFWGGESAEKSTAPSFGPAGARETDPSKRWKQILSTELEKSTIGGRETTVMLDEAARILKKIEEESLETSGGVGEGEGGKEWEKERAMFVAIRAAMGSELQQLEAACDAKRLELTEASKQANALVDVFFQKNTEQLDKISARVAAVTVAAERVGKSLKVEHHRQLVALEQQAEALYKATKVAEHRRDAANAEAAMLKRQQENVVSALAALRQPLGSSQ